MILGYLILALVALAVFHFILEGIVAPSHHMVHRLELLRIARELDALQAQAKPDDVRIYEYLRKAVHNFINGMPHYNIARMVKVMHKLSSDAAFREAAQANHLMVENSQAPHVSRIHSRVNHLAGATMTWNSFGWAIYVVPVVAAVAMYRQAHQAISAILEFPGKQLEQSDRNNGSQFGSL